MAALTSSNPVFVSFSTLDATKEYSLDGTVQKGAELLEKLSEPAQAKAGYGIGYAGTTQAIAGNISWDGPDVPFSTPFADIPWGKAILCKAVVTPATESAPEKIALTTLQKDYIHGTCYGVTVKDCSYQLNAGISVAEGVTFPEDVTKDALVLAIVANASFEGDVLVDSGETVVAVSTPIDPTVFNLSSDGLKWNLPNAIGGYTFTVRGNLLVASNRIAPSVYTSLKDTLSSYPVSQAVLAAKINS